MESNNLQSFYLQVQYLLLSTVELTAGARFDNSSVYDQVLTPRMGLVYNKDYLTAKLLYMEAFRAPKPWDYNWGSGNRGLEPERMKSMEFFFANNIHRKLRAEASLYRNIVFDILVKNLDPKMWVNRGKLETDGFELTLSHHSRDRSSYINYTYNKSRFDSGELVPEIAMHSANVGILYALTNNFKINVSGNYLGRRKNPSIIPATGKDIINPAFIVNSVLTYSDLYNMDIQLLCKNILNTEYYHPSNRPVSRFRQPQRTIMLKVEYKF
jgi:outer membrane receptor protein involved in Fe transport